MSEDYEDIKDLDEIAGVTGDDDVEVNGEELEITDDAQASGKFSRLLESDSRRYKLSGMFKDWFLDYSSYVILARAR